MGVGLSRCLDDPLLLPFLFGRVVDVGLQSFLGRARRGYCLGMLACALCGAIAVGICRAVADVACGDHTSKSLLSKGSASIGKESQVAVALRSLLGMRIVRFVCGAIAIGICRATSTKGLTGRGIATSKLVVLFFSVLMRFVFFAFGFYGFVLLVKGCLM